MADLNKNIGEINREHFDSVAATIWKQPWVLDLLEHITTLIRSNIDWTGIPDKSCTGSTRMLDYACGNGTAALAFAPWVSSIRGIDISAGMVEQFNSSTLEAGLSADQMSAIQGDLLAEPRSPDLSADPSLFNFDLAVMSMALHHVRDTDLMLSRLVERLSPGGVLLIVDWGAASAVPSGSAKVLGPSSGAEGGHPHPHPHVHGHGHAPPQAPAAAPGKDCKCGRRHSRSRENPEEDAEKLHTTIRTVAHKHGFSEQEMLAMFSRAGLEEAAVVSAEESFVMPEGMGGERRLFLARGRKPAAGRRSIRQGGAVEPEMRRAEG
ncbi:hypothetical protein MKZ38_008161 [Zalerion maritima]|uniref:Methyltransferase domain-containing protein n=1 Tax=Zalerion maritima TaxID=339359 RepID=A0AAD5WV87_9PEZI|nr:hypothetical protein MKZ38_008161 [Zalerion maritima]